MEFLLVETDSPDQPPPELKGGFNEPRTLLSVAEKIAEIKKIKAAEVLDRSSANLRKLLQL
jgi:TatD DNase family protein